MGLNNSTLAVVRWLLAGVCGVMLPDLADAQGTTMRVSVRAGGGQAQYESNNAAISADSRWVAFDSPDFPMVPGDNNDLRDVFVHDRQTGTTTWVSVGLGGIAGNGASGDPSISADGRFIAFVSSAGNLVANDTNFASDVFVRDRQTGTTTRVSVSSAGVQANNSSFNPSISADGRWVSFESHAANMIATGDTNNGADVFLHDRQTGTTRRVNVGPAGVQGNASNPTQSSYGSSISADGRWIAFVSQSNNLVASDTNNSPDVFLHDQQTATTIRVSVDSSGSQIPSGGFGPVSMSADARWVTFGGSGLMVYDRHAGAATVLAAIAGNGPNTSFTISADGRWVAFDSFASDLVPGDTNSQPDVFVHDRQTGGTTRVSVSSVGVEGNAPSRYPSISADGRVVAFDSVASTLVAGDTNARTDVFAHTRGSATCGVALAPTSASVAVDGGTGGALVLGSADCVWTAVSDSPTWLTLTGVTAGLGLGTVSYSVATNAGVPRTGNITIGSQTFTINQTGADVTTPLPPTGLVASVVAGNTVTLRWLVPSTGPAPTGYVLEGGVTPGQVLASIPTGTTAPTFTIAAPSGSFYLRVHSTNGAFKSPASNEILVHVNVAVAPSAPASLLGMVNGSSLALAWTNTYAGGAPTSVTLNVSGSINASVPLGLSDIFSFAGVPPGTYTFTAVASNAAGSSAPSNPVTLTFPSSCSGAPQAVTNFAAYQVGGTVFLNWDAPAAGAAPSGYVLNVTGAYVGSVPTPLKLLSAAVPPGAYTFTVVATNPCGSAAATAPRTVVVP